MNYTHQLLVYADDVNFFFGGGERKRTIKKNTEALLAASKETGLRVNAQKISVYYVS